VDQLTLAAIAAAAGDAGALERFVRLSQAEVWRLCSHLASPAEADDLTQEVYARALPARERFRGDASARTWLLSIARRACADHLRRRLRRRRTEDSAVGHASRFLSSDDPADLATLQTLVAGLPVDQREAFVLTQVIGLSYLEAAAVCGCPIGTIRSRVARARERLIVSLRPESAEA